MTKQVAALFMIIVLLGLNKLSAQEYIEPFQEGKNLYEAKDYYEAYLRFNAAYVLSDIAGNTQFAAQCQEWLNKSALGIQQQQQRTDSLLQATKKLTDAFYFYDNRLALAYKDYLYGFINRKGEVEIDYQYSSATNFEEETGYAKVEKDGKTYWLNPDGKEYAGDQDVKNLPKVEKLHPSDRQPDEFVTPVLSELSGNKDYHTELNDGIRLYNKGLYYEAYLRFNAGIVLAENAEDHEIALFSSQLKDTAVYEIRQLITRADEALSIAKNIRDAFYFYEDRFALAFKNDKFYFIDKNGDEVEKLGKWEKVEELFSYRRGFAKAKKEVDGKLVDYLLDTLGNTYLVAYDLKNIRPEITALDLSGKELTEIPAEVFEQRQLKILLLNDNQLTSLPDKIGELKNLTELNLRSNQLTRLPAEIGELKNLTKLDLEWNKLSSLPSEIGELKNLTELSLTENLQLSSLPSEIGELKNLTELSLVGNNLTNLPSEIGELKNLTRLGLMNNQLTSLPVEIGELENLTELNLEYNELSSLPSEIGELKNLTRLDLMNNQLTSLPVEIGELKNLTRLDLDRNRLTQFPSIICQLRQLEYLSLVDNYIEQIPAEISNLQKLGIFHLGFSILYPPSGYKLELPNSFGYLKSLEILSLEDCQISKLPDTFTQLKQLEELYMPGNQLNELPEDIGQLEKLILLNLSKNELQELPESFTKLSQLEELYMPGNQLKILPKEIGQLEKLTHIALSKNGLQELPESFTKLSQLEKLYMSENQLKVLPEEIGKLKKLIHIDLSKNKLQELPESLTELPLLKELNIEGNNLETLPKDIGKLNNLQNLYLSENELHELPETFGLLKDLINVKLFDNKLEVIPNSFGQLNKLAFLDIGKNKLTVLPISFDKLSNLKILSLGNNKFTALPKCVPSLANLEYLNLKNNKLKEFRLNDGAMDKLEELFLSGNQISKFPQSILYLKNLKKLGLGSSKLNQLPNEFELLYKLEELYLKENNFHNIPESIFKLSNLKTLVLGGNQIDFVPKEITQLGKLEELYLWGNNLKRLPESIGDLEYLQRLDIYSNQLEDLPKSLLKLEQLYNLEIDNNPKLDFISIWKSLSEHPRNLEFTTNLEEKNEDYEWLLVKVDISQCKVEEIFQRVVEEEWSENQRIKVFYHLLSIYSSELKYGVGDFKGATETLKGITQVLEELLVLQNSSETKVAAVNMYYILASLQLLEGGFKEAKLSVQRMVELGKDIDYIIGLAKGELKDLMVELEDVVSLSIEEKQQVQELSINFYNVLAMCLILTNNFEEAEKTIRDGMKLEGNNLYLPVNLAPALLFQGKIAEAEEWYVKMKDKTFSKGGFETYKDVFLDDFQTFENEGIIPDEYKKDVEKIKELLKE